VVLVEPPDPPLLPKRASDWSVLPLPIAGILQHLAETRSLRYVLSSGPARAELLTLRVFALPANARNCTEIWCRKIAKITQAVAD
jgi:hypothetical protein